MDNLADLSAVDALAASREHSPVELLNAVIDRDTATDANINAFA